MSAGPPKIDLVFYRTDAGSEPVRVTLERNGDVWMLHAGDRTNQISLA